MNESHNFFSFSRLTFNFFIFEKENEDGAVHFYILFYFIYNTYEIPFVTKNVYGYYYSRRKQQKKTKLIELKIRNKKKKLKE